MATTGEPAREPAPYVTFHDDQAPPDEGSPGTLTQPLVDQEPLDDMVDATPDAVPVWDEQARADAAAAAATAVTAYAADLDPDSWWRGLAPLLTPTGQTAYAEADPRNVPAGALTGPPVVPTDTPSTFLVQVDVPTDVGPYGVLLARTAAGQPWLVERFLPPVSDGAAAP
ncbi:hypothetical protein [Aquipuribacter hungaricus]|uniref:Uncharacterized protein n=1 Tax=Aquipuribacter hungaricus TaxID=545624 RepID=A0ABV7WKE2_9MICO